MNTENTKLLDLQTGKYLELGKDWGYFGKFILLNLGSAIELNIKEWGSVSYGDNAYGWHGYIGQEIKQPHTDPIINEIADRLGAVIYGGRYVLLEFKQYCDEELRKIVDIVTAGLCVCDRVWDGWNVGTMSRDDFRQFDDGECEDVSDDKVNDLKNAINKQYIALEIFEECSKQLRNEPNKFEELKKFIK